jgi:hypothetical protein
VDHQAAETMMRSWVCFLLWPIMSDCVHS